MSNITGKNCSAGENQDILDDPQVIELLSKYTEEIRNHLLAPEEFISNHGYQGYQGPAKQEILREMRFVATLESIYSNKRQQDSEASSKNQTRKAITEITEIMLNKLRTIK